MKPPMVKGNHLKAKHNKFKSYRMLKKKRKEKKRKKCLIYIFLKFFLFVTNFEKSLHFRLRPNK